MKFYIHKASNGQYYFVIKGGNGETVATSELYVYKSSAQSTIDSMKRSINVNTPVIDLT